MNIVDLANPEAPACIGGYAVVGTPYHVSIAGDIVYAADFDGGIWLHERQCELLGVPDPAMSVVSPWDAFGHALLCPGTTGGLDEVGVTLRDVSGQLLPGRDVVIDLGDCDRLCVDSAGSGLAGTTSAGGTVNLDPRVGGCEVCDVVVWADGVPLRTYPRTASPGWDGEEADGVVDEADQACFESVLGSADACADYDGDGLVALADFNSFTKALGSVNARPCLVDPAATSCRGRPAMAKAAPGSGSSACRGRMGLAGGWW